MPVRTAKSKKNASNDKQLSMETLKTRHWIESINRLGAVLEIDPTNVEAMYSIAVAHNELGDSKTAQSMLGRAIAIEPNHAGMHHDLAALLSDDGRYLEAANSAIRAVELEPENDEFVSLLSRISAHIYEGKLTCKRQSRKPAQLRIDAILSRINSTLLYASSICDEQTDGRPDMAIYSEVLATGHDSAELRLKLGISLQSSGDYAGAEENYRLAIELNANSPLAHTALGMLCAEQHRLADALQSFAQAVDVDETYSKAYFGAADLLYSAEMYTEASVVYQSGLAHDPENARGFLALGNCYYCMGAPDAAVMAYRQVLALRPGYPEAVQNLAVAQQLALPKAA